MRIHVSYHPFAPADAHSFCFDDMGRDACIERLTEQLGLEPDASVTLKAVLSHGGCVRPEGMSLRQTHAYNMAKVSDLLCNCWYTSNYRFSALLEFPDFGRYVTDWRYLMPEGSVREPSAHERFVPRNDVVFLSCEGLKRLRADYAEHGAVRSQLHRAFPRGWLPIFWAAADYAVARDRGLIEAKNLVRPDAIAPSSLMA